MSYNDYVDMCIQSGLEFNIEEAPVRLTDLSYDFQTAWGLYHSIRNQLVISPVGAPIAIDIKAIDVIFRFYNIPEYKVVSLYDKINFIFDTIQVISAPAETVSEVAKEET